jgi:hypothetical protein
MQSCIAFEVAALTVSPAPEKHLDDLVATPECRKVQRKVAVALAIVDVDRPLQKKVHRVDPAVAARNL